METLKLFNYDKKYLPKIVAGMDEAGRGPLAGPVVAACCIMPLKRGINGVNDSKQLTESAREKLYERIIREAVCFGVGVTDNVTVDKINILNATRLAMKEAASKLKIRPSVILVDAVNKLDIDIEYLPIIGGDALSYNIAAASIIAKVHRDRLMREYDKIYPGLSFSSNKGYGTRAHLDALKNIGKTEIHRDSFLIKFNEREKYSQTDFFDFADGEKEYG